MGNALGEYSDLNRPTDVCFTLPDTCENGGTMAVWVKIRETTLHDIIYTIIKTKWERGFSVYYVPDQ